MTKISGLPDGSATIAADDLLPFVDVSETGAARNKTVQACAIGARSLGWVNVTDPTYGATGDGTTDDAAAIAAASLAAGAYGTVYFPPGQYRMTSGVTISSIGQRWLGVGRGASVLWKETTADLVTVSGVAFVEFQDLGILARTGVSATYGTTGAGIRFTGAADDCTAHNLDIQLIDTGGLYFDASAGKRFHGSHLHFEPYTTTPGSEGYIINCAGADSGAMQRHFVNFVGSGRVNLVGSLDMFLTNGAVRSVVMDSACAVCTFSNMRYGNLNNNITLDGGSNAWVNCAFSGTVYLAATLVNSAVFGVLTGGSGLINLGCTGVAVWLYDGAQGTVQTIGDTTFRNQRDADLTLLLRAGSTADQDISILFGNYLAGTTHAIQRTNGGAFVLSDVAAGKSFLNQIPSSGNLQIGAVGTGGIQFNILGGGTGGVSFYDGAAGPTLVASLASTGRFTGKRIIGNGTAHVAGDYALSGGWGATATVSAVSAKDSGGRVSITCNGAGVAANPTVALTFKDGAWGAAPSATASRGDVVAPAGGYWALTGMSSTVATWTFVGLPVAGSVYVLDFITVGK